MTAAVLTMLEWAGHGFLVVGGTVLVIVGVALWRLAATDTDPDQRQARRRVDRFGGAVLVGLGVQMLWWSTVGADG